LLLLLQSERLEKFLREKAFESLAANAYHFPPEFCTGDAANLRLMLKASG